MGRTVSGCVGEKRVSRRPRTVPPGLDRDDACDGAADRVSGTTISGEGVHDPDVSGRDLVEIRVAPRAELIATVRVAAADFAARADFDFDFDVVSDVRMAVDEACNEVLPLADPAGLIRVGFGVHHGGLRVVVSAPARPERAGIDTGGFGWRVLGAVTDELATELVSGDGGDQIVVRFVMRPRTATAQTSSDGPVR